jgi:hypothetical protein
MKKCTTFKQRKKKTLNGAVPPAVDGMQNVQQDRGLKTVSSNRKTEQLLIKSDILMHIAIDLNITDKNDMYFLITDFIFITESL